MDFGQVLILVEEIVLPTTFQFPLVNRHIHSPASLQGGGASGRAVEGRAIMYVTSRPGAQDLLSEPPFFPSLIFSWLGTDDRAEDARS